MSCPHCPHCIALSRGQPLPDTAALIAARVEDLRQRCLAKGLSVSLVDRVTEATAADILGKAPGTLRNWRGQGEPLPFVRVGGRIWYDLASLAAFDL